MIKKNLNLNYFLFLIIISSSIYFLWSIKILNDFPWRYVFTDWIINYEGGYIRRGLLGEISINLSDFFNLDIKYIFFILHFSIYLIFHLLFYAYFKNYSKNYIFYFLCFSPLVFLYPVATFEAFSRKEIFYITLFLLSCYISIKINNRKIIFSSTNLLVLLSYLIHESSIFFINFFYLTFFIFLKKNNYKLNFFEILIIIVIYLILLFLLFIPVTDEKITVMVSYINENFFEITEFSGAISWLKRSASSSFLFLEANTIHLTDYFRYLILLHFIIIFCFLLKKNNYFKIDKFISIFTVLSLLSPLCLFILANDWGRLTYIYYNFALIFTFYFFYNDRKIFLKIDNLKLLQNINYKLKIFFTICYISLWTPQIFFYDKIDFFPLYDLLINLANYSIKYSKVIF